MKSAQAAPEPAEELWPEFAIGHELTDILGRGLRRTLGSLDEKLGSRENIERLLRLTYSRKDFAQSNLYKALRAWEQKNCPFQVVKH